MVIQGYQSPQEQRQASLTHEYATLSAQFAAVTNKKLETLNPGDQVVLEQQAQAILSRLQTVHAELEALKQSSSDVKQRSTILDQHLPQLDFNLAKQRFKTLLEQFDVDGQGGSAVLLLQKSNDMLGDICLRGIQDSIRHLPGEDLKLFPLEFTSATWDEKEVLRGLGRYLGQPEEVSDVSQYIQDLRQSLINSLCGYTTLFIELHGWDNLPTNTQIQLLSWFLNDFWQPLVADRRRRAEDYDNIRCIVAIVVAGELESVWYDLPYFKLANTESSDHNKLQDESVMIELPLTNWTQIDIETWLKKCPKLDRTRSQEIAARIIRITNGLPLSARARLERELQNC